jgi:hypothetical protein
MEPEVFVCITIVGQIITFVAILLIESHLRHIQRALDRIAPSPPLIGLKSKRPPQPVHVIVHEPPVTPPATTAATVSNPPDVQPAPHPKPAAPVRWRVRGVDRESGLDVFKVIEAGSESEAAVQAGEMGIQVTDIVRS